MLITSEERIRLLKNGIEHKTIEELYIQHNRLKIIKSPILLDFMDITLQESMNSTETPVIEIKRSGQTDGDSISLSAPVDSS